MAWFTNSSSAPTVATQKDIQPKTLSIVAQSGTTVYRSDETTTQFEKRGMTLAAADSAVTALAADSTVSNISRSPIGANGYNVRYTQTTTTAWS